MPRAVARAAGLAAILCGPAIAGAQPPAVPHKVDTPGVKVLTGLTVPQFEQEMQHFVQAMGVTCNGSHMR